MELQDGQRDRGVAGMGFGAHLPLMDFGGHPYTLDHLVAYTTAASQPDFRALSANDDLVFSVRVARLADGWLASAYNTTPELFAETLQAFAEAGVQRVFILPVADEVAQLERFWNEVRPLVATT